MCIRDRHKGAADANSESQPGASRLVPIVQRSSLYDIKIRFHRKKENICTCQNPHHVKIHAVLGKDVPMDDLEEQMSLAGLEEAAESVSVVPASRSNIYETTFGKLASGPEPDFVNVAEDPFNGREVVTRRLTPIRFGMIGFRMPQPRHEDNIALGIIRNLFNNNSSTGLLDRLSIENKLLGSSAISGLGGADHGAMGFMFIPKLIFQTFKGAENVVLDQIERVKQGDFSEEYLQSIKLSIIRSHESGLENASNRLNYAMDIILNDRTCLLYTSDAADE